MKCRLLVSTVSCAVVLCSSATAETIELFGTTYEVQRLDYYEGFEFPNPLPEYSDMIALRETEGIRWAGNGRIIFVSEKMSQVTAKTIAVEVGFEYDLDGNIVAFDSDSAEVLFWQDPPLPPNDGFDLSPSGLAINTSDSGIGAGGNLIVTDTENQIVHGYNYTTGERIAWPHDPAVPETDPLWDGWFVTPEAYEPEDVVYVPHLDRLFIPQEDEDGTYGGFRIVSFDPMGNFYEAESFDVVQGSTYGKPKGLAYLPDVDTYPCMFRGLGGVLLLSLDDDGPALEAYDLAGNLILDEWLGDDQDVLDPGLGTLGLEGAATDPETGRLFLSQQGSETLYNYLYILTPVGPIACVGDMNCDGAIDFGDINPFVAALGGQSAYEAAYPDCDWFNADVNADGVVDFDDINPFVALLSGAK